MKRKLNNASLAASASQKILSTEAVFNYYSKNMPKITFFNLSKSEIDETRSRIRDCFSKEHTVVETKSFHHFSPSQIGTIQFKRVSLDKVFAGSHSFCSSQNVYELDDIPPQTYVVSMYDESWCVGLVEKHDSLHSDILVSFMHPQFPMDLANLFIDQNQKIFAGFH